MTAWRGFIRAYEPFSFDPTRGDVLPAVREYMEIWEPSYVANCVFYVLGTLVADSFMVRACITGHTYCSTTQAIDLSTAHCMVPKQVHHHSPFASLRRFGW